ncbi:MAG: hypothetical protein ACAI38_09900 [Myxococcota bacterium]|nr:hypothetical protein [Myxococcota bacterium]
MAFPDVSVPAQRAAGVTQVQATNNLQDPVAQQIISTLRTLDQRIEGRLGIDWNRMNETMSYNPQTRTFLVRPKPGTEPSESHALIARTLGQNLGINFGWIFSRGGQEATRTFQGAPQSRGA